MRVLVLSPHPDDMEFGCGGTVSKLNMFGHEIRQLIFCLAPGLGVPKDVRKEEALEAARLLGLKGTQVSDFPHRNFGAVRQEILDYMVKVNDEFGPNVVYTPATTDHHQDHKVITEEAIRAFRYQTVLGYELPWNNISFNHAVFEILYPRDVDRKWESIAKHKSILGRRPYHNEEFVRSLARMRGAQIGRINAEVFEAIRIVREEL